MNRYPSLLLLSVALAACAASDAALTPQAAAGHAIRACQERVMHAAGAFLVAPSAAVLEPADSATAFLLNPAGVPGPPPDAFEVLTYVEAPNEYGVPIRHHFRCVARRTAAGWATEPPRVTPEDRGLIKVLGLADTTTPARPR